MRVTRGRSISTGLAATIGAATLVLGASATAAIAAPTHHTTMNDHGYRHGVVLTRQLAAARHGQEIGIGGLPGVGSQTLSYGGGIDGIGVTSGPPKVYLVFYGSQWGTQGTNSKGDQTFTGDPNGAAPYVQEMLKGFGTGGETWSGTMTQYCDGPGVAAGATSCPSGAAHVGYPTGGALAGVWYDNSVASPGQANGNTLGTEAVKAAQHFGNTSAPANRYAQYVIVSPTGTHPDGFNTTTGQFCAWHDYNGDAQLTGGPVNSPYGDVAFTNLPYVTDMGSSCGQNFVNSGGAGTLDGFSIVEGHEYSETITDQNPAGGWTNTQLLSTYNGQENADECAWLSSGQGAAGNVTTGTGTFAMQSSWSNDTNECDLTHPIVH